MLPPISAIAYYDKTLIYDLLFEIAAETPRHPHIGAYLVGLEASRG